MEITLSSLTEKLNARKIPFQVSGQDKTVNKLCSIRKIEPAGLYYLIGDLKEKFEEIESSIIITDTMPEDLGGNTIIVVDAPQRVFYYLCQDLSPKPKHTGIHATAIIDPEAKIHPEVSIGAYCVVGKCTLGKGVRLLSHVVLFDKSILGENVTIESNSCIGATGVAWVWDEEGKRVIQPQFGGVRIENDVFIGTDVTIVRGSLNEDSIIGENTMIAHGTKLGHGTVVGKNCHFANNVSIAGSVLLGEGSFLGSGCTVRPRMRLAEGTIVGAGAVVTKHVEKANCILAGVPAKIMKKKNKAPQGMPKPFKR